MNPFDAENHIEYMIPFPGFNNSTFPLFLSRETKHIIIWNIKTMRLTKICEIKKPSFITGESKLCFINKHEKTGDYQFLTHKDSSLIVKIKIPAKIIAEALEK